MTDEPTVTRVGAARPASPPRTGTLPESASSQFLDDDVPDTMPEPQLDAPLDDAPQDDARRDDARRDDARARVPVRAFPDRSADERAAPDRAVTRPERSGPDSGSIPVVRHARDEGEDHGPRFATRMVAVALAVLIGVSGGVVALTWVFGRAVGGLNPFHETTIDRSGPPVLQSLNDLKTYHAASGYYEIVIDQQKDVANLPSFLAGERVIFVAAGTVDATVDFSKLGAGAVTTNPERTAVTIALPAVTLGKPQLDLDRSYVADHQRGLRERLQDAAGTGGSGQDTAELYRVAERKLAEAGARTDDLTERARSNTRAMLTTLLNQVGYTQVTVTFAETD